MNEQQIIRDALTVLETVPDDQFDMELCCDWDTCGCVIHHMARQGKIPLQTYWPNIALRWLKEQGASHELLLILGFSDNSEAYYKVYSLEEVTKEQVVFKLQYLLAMSKYQ